MRASKIKSRHVILRLTFNSVKTSIWMDTLPKIIGLAFPSLKSSWDKRNKSDYVWTLPNGSEIWIGGLDDDKRVEKILGKEYSTIYFNESSQLSYSAVQVALTRLAEKNSLKKKVYYDCNPPNRSHWSYWLFEKKLDPVDAEPLKRPDNYSSFLMNPVDNMENIDEEYVSMLESLPEKERQRFLLGQYTDSSDGIAYYSFNPDTQIVDRTVMEPGTLFIGMDFNVDPMTAVIFQLINNTFYIHDEIYLKNSDTYKMCSELLKRKYKGDIIPDSTGRNRKTSGKSDHDILREAGFRVVGTRNPFVNDRVNNANRIFTEDRIRINKRCKKLINDLTKVSWKDNKLDQKTDPELTHISDALTYGLWKLDPISIIRNRVTVSKLV